MRYLSLEYRYYKMKKIVFPDEIINHILSFREKHPFVKTMNSLIKEYSDLGDHIVFEYYHDNEPYEYSFAEWIFLYGKL